MYSSSNINFFEHYVNDCVQLCVCVVTGTDIALLCSPYHTPCDMPVLGGLADYTDAEISAMGKTHKQALTYTPIHICLF